MIVMVTLLLFPVMTIGFLTGNLTLIWISAGMALFCFAGAIKIAFNLLTWRPCLMPDDFCDRIEVEVEVRLTQCPDSKP